MAQALDHGYKPLDSTTSIRLLILDHIPWLSSDSSPIVCKLSHMVLTPLLDYKALSYEWGSEDNPKTIILDGKAFRIRQNLWWALQHIRKDVQYKNTRFWIDAICINQNDDQERSHQVSLMGTIYRSAKEVICWLGRKIENESYGKAMEFVAVAARNRADFIGELSKNDQGENAGRNGRSAGISSVEPPDFLRISSTPRSTAATSIARERIWDKPPPTLFDHSVLPSMEALCSHSYWRRTWIIQELVLAHQVVIRLGDQSIEGSVFASISKAVLMYHLTEEGMMALPAPRVMELREKFVQGLKINLMDLMEISEKSSCQDLRDRAYAMMGLARDCQKNELIPDYSKSLVEIYKDVVLDHYYSSSLGKHRASWDLVRASQLVQRCFWSVSGSVQVQEKSQQDLDILYGSDHGDFLQIGGFYLGTISERGQCDDSGMWWAHPGFVKPIESSRSFAGLHVHSWTEKIVSFLKVKKIDIGGTEPIQQFLLETGQRIFAPGQTQKGDLICQFWKSDIVAVFRRTFDTYALVGRAMILDERDDVSTFNAGWDITIDEFLDKHWRNRNLVLCSITPTALQQLTSPHY